MLKLNLITLKKSINKAYLKIKPVREDFENFRKELQKLLSVINEKESEEHNKNFVRDFLINTFYSEKSVNTKGRTDLAIHLDKTGGSFAGVIIETKSPVNKSDMISEDNLNFKAMHEVILYYLRERIEHKNDEIKTIIITNAYEWFIFKSDQFEKYFYKSRLKDEYEKWRSDQKVSKLNEHFYNEIVKKFLDETDAEIEAVSFDLRDFEKYLDKGDEKELIPLFKKFSPPELLREPFANDSNTLNKQFYSELLHIIGLEEYKEKSKKKIDRKRENRDNGSLIENTIRILKTKDVLKNFDDKSVYGTNEEEQLYNIALELNIIWINRILFLKLLEGQLVNYHDGDENYKFLELKVINQYDDLFELFHQVLAVKTNERNSGLIGRFSKIPYLNSSLFELSEIEKKTIDIASLKNKVNLFFYKNTIFGKDVQSKGFPPALDYLLLFLNAFDFASEGSGEILEERKTIINASVLGLIFEKINGYKEGSFYTPGFITMYMARETLRRAVVQKYNEAKGTAYKDYDELKRNIDTSSPGREEANKIINSLKICDPAVGSGHFLVSCLNEIIAIKADLRILNYRDGRQVQNYSLEIENDELIITNEETVELLDYHLNPSGKQVTALQDLQETLFHEKETIIENCLFGVDINPNSVNICRLRLWIELLKNAYYTKESNYTELETLPNIDINIKQGNSLISRFKLDIDLRKALKTIKYTIEDYKMFVQGYRTAKNKEEKRNFTLFIEEIKKNFRYEISINDPRRKKLSNLAYELHNKFQTERLIDVELTEQAKKKLKAEEKILKQEIEQRTKELEAEDKGELYRDAFEWRFEFPEALDDEGNFVGFDVVIGNPPYMLLENKIFNNLFRLIKANANSYVAFIELSIKIMKDYSSYAMIIPNTWLAGNNFIELRRRLLSEKILKRIIQLPYDIFEVYVDTLILFLEKGIKREFAEYYKFSIKDSFDMNFNIQTIELSNWQDDNLTIFLENKLLKLFPKYKENSIKLENVAKVQRGTLPPQTTYLKNEKFTNSIKWFNGQVYRYIFENPENELFVDYNALQENKPIELFKTEKIIGRQLISRQFRLQFTYTNTEYAFKKNLYAIYDLDKSIFDYKYLLGILNSKFFSYIQVKLNASGQRDDYPAFSLLDYKNFLIKLSNKKTQKELSNVVEQIILKKAENPKANTSTLEKEIDEMVYKLYGLTEEEIKIVEGM